MIPYDREAEEQLAAVIVATPQGAQLAASRLSPSDFHRPEFGRILDALPSVRLSDVEERIAVASEVSGMFVAELRQMVHDRPHDDRSGALAGRVKSAAESRRALGQVETFRAGLESGLSVSEASKLSGIKVEAQAGWWESGRPPIPGRMGERGTGLKSPSRVPVLDEGRGIER